jgi:3-oxoacyl-[acyl-carrier protein] reductase
MISIDLSGQTALITGGGQGIGAAAVRRLHEAGANVVINYFEDAPGVNRARADALTRELGQRALAAAADVRDRDAVQAMMRQTVARFGGLDIVVNNAAVLRDRTLRKMNDDEWQSVIDTNLTGVFNVCKAAVGSLNAGGRIVNLASIAAVIGFFGQSNYAAAKAGVIAMTRVLSRELAGRKIRVNAVAPGLVDTEMARSIPDDARVQMLANVPLGRMAQPAEVADVIVLLCSDLTSYVTGQTIHVNGGWFG